MIIIRVLKVGLGNQLFEYAYGRYLAKKNNQKLYIYFPIKMDHGSTFENGLGLLDIKVDKRINRFQMIFLSRGRNILHLAYMFKEAFFNKSKHINLGLEKSIGEKLARKGILINYDTSNDKAYFDQKRDITYARGYFQFPQYIYANETELVNMLKFKGGTLEKYEDLIKMMQDSVSVAVHMRRGDYLNNQRLVTCDDNYYIKAIKKMNSIFSCSTFFVFSDDYNYIKSKIFWFENRKVYFIQDLFSKNIRDIDELRLMGYCKHFIISNSTFSWWGQFAGTYVNKVVIAPDKWYTSGKSGLLYDKNWYLMEC